jgi:ABC-type methionine transport system permease subunit
VERRRNLDAEARIGWGLVPVAMLLAFKMNAARHLMIVLLVPDKSGARNLAAAAGLGIHALMPGLVRFNSLLPIVTVFLIGILVWHLKQIGWDVVRRDLRRGLVAP